MSSDIRRARAMLAGAYLSHLDREIAKGRAAISRRAQVPGVIPGSVLSFDRAYPSSSPTVRAAELRMLADAERGAK